MKNLTIAAMAAIVLLTASSCDKSNDDNTQVTMLLNQTQISYDSNGVWTDAMAEGTNVVSHGGTDLWQAAATMWPTIALATGSTTSIP